jgi:hypothetical protein
MRLLSLLAPLLILGGCGSEPELAPGGVSQSEADALNDAAEMLDNRSLMPSDATEETAE